MKKKTLLYITVFHSDEGFKNNTCARLFDLFDIIKPDFFQFLTPTAIMIFCKNSKKHNIIISEVIAASKANPEEFPDISICDYENECICNETIFGRILDEPFELKHINYMNKVIYKV